MGLIFSERWFNSSCRYNQNENMKQHTPAPWTVSPHTHIDKRFEIPEPSVFVDYDDVDHEQQDINARRIVACINACEGIPLSKLETMTTGGLHHAFEEYKTRS